MGLPNKNLTPTYKQTPSPPRRDVGGEAGVQGPFPAQTTRPLTAGSCPAPSNLQSTTPFLAEMLAQVPGGTEATLKQSTGRSFPVTPSWLWGGEDSPALDPDPRRRPGWDTGSNPVSTWLSALHVTPWSPVALPRAV